MKIILEADGVERLKKLTTRFSELRLLSDVDNSPAILEEMESVIKEIADLLYHTVTGHVA